MQAHVNNNCETIKINNWNPCNKGMQTLVQKYKTVQCGLKHWEAEFSESHRMTSSMAKTHLI